MKNLYDEWYCRNCDIYMKKKRELKSRPKCDKCKSVILSYSGKVRTITIKRPKEKQ